MDTLAPAQQGIETALKQWQQAGQTLIKSAGLCGVDTTPFVSAFIGTARPARMTGGGTTTRRRSTSRSTARSHGNGGGTPGSKVSEESFLGYLREAGGATQAQIAEHFGVSSTAAGNYVKRWGELIEKDGRIWRARQPVAA